MATRLSVHLTGRPPFESRTQRATSARRRKLRQSAALAMATSAAALLTLFLALTPSATYAQTTSPEQQLADKFAPVAYLRVQEAACDRDGEGYLPAPVEVVLGNPEVALKHHGDGGRSATDPIIKMAPTAQDLVGLDEDFYLDFPGNLRRPGCTFERDFKRFAAAQGIQPTAYAHIVIDEDEQQLVLQYWVWWYFKQCPTQLTAQARCRRTNAAYDLPAIA